MKRANNRRSFRWIAIGALVGLFAVACGDDGSASQPDGAAQTPSTTAGASGSTTTVPVKYDTNANFRWAYTVDTTSFDPDRITTSGSQVYLRPIYDRLVYLGYDLVPKPMLAKSWAIQDGGATLE